MHLKDMQQPKQMNDKQQPKWWITKTYLNSEQWRTIEHDNQSKN
jgi:hypothetical protein